MEIRQLRYFISVAKHLNFTEAANELFVAQSAVSQQISYLEKQMGVKLFVRTKRSVKLTAAGHVLLKEAISIINKAEEVIEKAQKAESGKIGSLKIGFLASPVRDFLPLLIKRFSNKYPDIEIMLHHFNLKQLNEEINSHDLDIVFTVSLGLQNVYGLEYKKLYSDSSCVYINHEHPLASAGKIHFADLAKESFIMRDRDESPQWYDYTLAACAKHGFTPTIVCESKRIESVLMFVDAGMGITIFPKYLKMYASPNIRMIEIEEEKDAIDIVVYRKKTNENPTIPLFMEELEKNLVMINGFTPIKL